MLSHNAIEYPQGNAAPETILQPVPGCMQNLCKHLCTCIKMRRSFWLLNTICSVMFWVHLPLFVLFQSAAFTVSCADPHSLRGRRCSTLFYHVQPSNWWQIPRSSCPSRGKIDHLGWSKLKRTHCDKGHMRRDWIPSPIE